MPRMCGLGLAWLAYAPAINLNSSARRPDEVHRDRAHLRQADLAYHLEQAIRVGLQELRELRPVEVGDLASGLLEARDHGLVLHEGADRVAQNARHVRGRLRRCKYAGPEDIDHVRISSLLQRRRVRKIRQPLGAPLRQDADVSGCRSGPWRSTRAWAPPAPGPTTAR